MKSMLSIVALAISLVMISTSAFGAYKPYQQKAKFPSQYILEKTSSVDVVTAGAANVLSAHAGATAAAPVTVTTFVAQPDYARNLVVTPGGTTADVAAGNVVVTGVDIQGNVITESFAFIADQSTAVTGNKAFKTITSIVIPAEDSPFGATWSVGFGAKLGLNGCLAGSGWYLKGLVDGADLTGSTVASSASDVSSNTIIPNPAPNGSRDFDLLFFPNYSCY